ncbi:MAG: S-methyl-5'-thioinosine phosphorylase [Betaproteobacteria bacterium]|nr:S-methyl-5'-thioinosine phosphorylase [Betaproteobacteria bacterium]
MLAIIGGSGLTQLANLRITHRQVIRTPYGEPSGSVTFGKIRDRDVAFLARHGYGHTIPPHLVNYRANIWALHNQKVKRVVSVAAVGGIRSDLAPGTIAFPEQVIDYTYGRKHTFFDTTDRSVTHVDFTHPYTEKLRQKCLQAAKLAGEHFVAGGVYAASQGPRLETAAEINRMERDGAHMVGMTGMPEAALVREIGLEYATIAVVANFAAGRGTSVKAVSLEQAHGVLEQAMGRVRNILEHLVEIDGD